MNCDICGKYRAKINLYPIIIDQIKWTVCNQCCLKFAKAEIRDLWTGKIDVDAIDKMKYEIEVMLK